MGNLIERVIEQICVDVSNTSWDVTALEELLSFIPKENLVQYLPEEEWEKYENEYMCDCCGGGFIKEEMDFDVNDQDLCKNCSYISFNDAPYGDE